MLRFLSVVIGASLFFVSSFFTMCVSDLIVKPFGLHGYTYTQAMAVDFVSLLSLLVVGGLYVLAAALWD